MVRITYFVHCTTTDNERGVATGWRPGKLSTKGRFQAQELGELVKQCDFDAVFCSDLARALETARIAFVNFWVVPDKRLREANYGDWNGERHSLFKDRLEDFIDNPFPHGESYGDVERRIRDFCTYLEENYSGKHVAIIAHQAPQLALDVILKGKTWRRAIAEDWRKTKAYQPGWDYEIT